MSGTNMTSTQRLQRLQQQQQQQTTTTTSSSSSSSTAASIAHFHQARARQYAHLQAQLAQLNAHLADMENLLHMTAVQAEYIKGLGGWWGGAFMAASKILGEDSASKARGGGVGDVSVVTPTPTVANANAKNVVAEK